MVGKTLAMHKKWNANERLTASQQNWMLVVPSLVMIGLFAVGLGWLLCISFLKYDPWHFYTNEITIENYIRVLQNPLYRNAVILSFEMAIISMVIAIVLGYPVAFFVVRFGGRLKGFLIGLIITTHLTSFVVKIYAWMIILTDNGVLNKILQWLRLSNGTLKLIGTNGGVIIALVYAGMPYVLLCLITGIEQIPISTEEAAATLGARPWYTFRRVIFPLSLPGVASSGLFVFALSITAFVAPMLLGGGRVAMLTTLLYQQTTQVGNYPLAASMAFILLIVSVTCIWLGLRVLRVRR